MGYMRDILGFFQRSHSIHSRTAVHVMCDVHVCMYIHSLMKLMCLLDDLLIHAFMCLLVELFNHKIN